MRGGYSPARGLQNTNPQWDVAPVEKKKKQDYNMLSIKNQTTFYTEWK
jgi:hypothetical protein